MLNAAIVGLGSWGKVLVEAVQGRSSKIRFTRAVTRTPSNARDFAAKHGLALDDDLAGLLKDPSIDGIVLATPHSKHRAQIEAAAAAGKPILVEKPLALTRDDATAAVEAARRAGVVLAVAQNRRFLPLVHRLKEMIDGGVLGQPLHVEGNFSGPSGFRHASSSWRGSRAESPAGGMTGRGMHVTDLMIHFFGPVVEVDARSVRRALTIDLDDTTAMLLRFASGMTGYLGTLTATADLWRLAVFGTRGWAEMRGYRTLTTCLIGEPTQTTEFPEFDMERAELEAFADAVAGRAPYPVPNGEVVNNVALLEAAVASASGIKPIRL